MKKRKLTYLFFILILIFGIVSFSQLEFKIDLGELANQPTNEFEEFNERNQAFKEEGGLSQVLVMLSNPKGFKSYGDFKRIKEINDKINSFRGVHKVESIVSVEYPRLIGFQTKWEKILNTNDSTRFKSTYAALKEYPDITPKFLSNDRQELMLYISLDSGYSYQSLGIEKENYDPFDFIVYDKEGQSKSYLMHELFRTGIAGVVLFLLLLYFFFRSIKLIGITLLLVGVNIAFVFIEMFLLNFSITQINSTIPVIIGVVSLTDIIHIVYHTHLLNGDKIEIIKTLKRPLFLTSLGTILAFAVFLFFYETPFLLQFGLIAVIATVFCYVITRFLFLDLILEQYSKTKGFKLSKAVFLEFFSIRNKWVAWGFIGVILILGGLQSNSGEIEWDYVYNQLTKEQKDFYHKYNNKFIGARKHELILIKDNILIYPSLKVAEQIEKNVAEIIHSNEIDNILLLIRRLNRYRHNGDPKYFKVPDSLSRNDWSIILSEQGKWGGKKVDQNALKFTLNYKEKGLQNALMVYDKLEKMTLPENWRLIQGGEAYFQDLNSVFITERILWSIFLALIVITLLMWGVNQSLRNAFLFLLANIIPLIFAANLYWLFDVPINPYTLFGLAILLGVVVDDTIYLMTKRSNSITDRLKPLRITTFIIAPSFLSLLFSQSILTCKIGAILFGSLLVGLMIDQFLAKYFHKKSPTS